MLMIDCAVDKLPEQLKFDVQELLECFFLLVDHVITKIGNVVVGWVVWALRILLTASVMFTLHRFLIWVEFKKLPKGLQNIGRLLVVQI